jgi:ABC-type transporter Mla subunit MlaD
MFRKLLALIALAALVWLGARYLAHRGEIKLTLVVPHADPVSKGDPVVEGDETIGRVIKTSHIDDGADAVVVRLDRKHRRDVVTDSFFSVENHRIAVSNTFAVGKPVEDGAVIHVKEDRLTRWLARHSGAAKQLIEKAKHVADQKLDAIDAELASAMAKVPDWKRDGKDVFQKNVDAMQKKIEKAEADLKRSDQAAEAKKLREKFDRWLAEVQH